MTKKDESPEEATNPYWSDELLAVLAEAQRVNMIKKFRWPKMEQDETRPLRLPKEARDYFATPE